MDLVNSFLANTQIWGANFFALIILAGVVFVFAMRGGKSSLITLVISLYVGYALYSVFPYATSIVALGTDVTTKAVMSIILFIIAAAIPFFFIRRSIAGFGSLHFLTNLILSLCIAGFTMALLYHMFDISHVYSFPKPIDQLFAPSGYFFYWFIAPLLGLFFLIR